jgi:hypothetical protein
MFEKITDIAGIIANYWDAFGAILWAISGILSVRGLFLKKIFFFS